MELPQKLRDLWSGTRINDNARRREVARRERKAAEDEAVRQSTEPVSYTHLTLPTNREV